MKTFKLMLNGFLVLAAIIAIILYLFFLIYWVSALESGYETLFFRIAFPIPMILFLSYEIGRKI